MPSLVLFILLSAVLNSDSNFLISFLKKLEYSLIIVFMIILFLNQLILN